MRIRGVRRRFKNPLLVINSGFQITSVLGVQKGKVYAIVSKIGAKQDNGVLPGVISAADAKPQTDEVK